MGLNDKSYSFVVQMGLINFTLTPIILKAIEVKDYRSSKVYLSEDIKREALMDIQLLKDKKVKQVEWVFKTHGDKKGEPSEPLKRFLESNGIKITIL